MYREAVVSFFTLHGIIIPCRWDFIVLVGAADLIF